jgi:mucin-19
MFGGAENISTVSLAGIMAIIQEQNESRIVVAAGNGENVTGCCILTASSGALVFSATNVFTYYAVGVNNSVSPNSGRFGTDVRIEGSRMLGLGLSISTITLGDTICTVTGTSINVFITCKIISHSLLSGNNQYDVALVSDTGAIVAKSGFFTILPEISVSSILPASGQFGTRVTVSGSRLLGGGFSIVSIEACAISVC